MFDRIIKNYITTILGLIFLCVAVWLYISKDHNEIEAGAVATIGAMLLRTKDSLIGLPPKGGDVIEK